MRVLISLLLLFFLAPLSAAPQRVVSMSLCTDQLLLWLAEPQQIAAVSYLAQDARYSHFAPLARAHKTHHADVESIVALKPDLVLASRYERSQATQILQRLGVNVLIVDSPQKPEQIRDYVVHIATVLNQKDKAEPVLLMMRQQLDFLQHHSDAHPRLAVSLSANGYQQGQASMHNQFMHLIGLRTAADELQWEFDGNLSLEQLAQLQADVFFVSDGERGLSLSERWAQHPIAQVLTRQKPTIELKMSDWICAGPWTVDAAMRLRTELQP